MTRQTLPATRTFAQRLGCRLRRSLTARDPRAVRPPKDFFASTAAWRDYFCSFMPLDAPHLIQRQAPQLVAGVNQSLDWEFSTRFQFQSPATFVVTLPQGRLAGHAVITPDDLLLADVSIEATVTPDNAWQHSVFKARVLPPPRKIAGRVVALSSAHCENSYYHWMFDLLPRLDILRRSGVQVGPNDCYAVNSLALPFQKDTLHTLGVDNIVEGGNHPHLQADVLVVPSLPGVMGNPPVWVCDFLRQSFLPVIKKRATIKKRLYISRKDAAYRRLLNEDAVVDVLHAHGFEVLALETMSFEEQVALFQDAEIVVAPHGAGLTNLVFCSPTTRVIELFSPLYVNGCYWALSDVVNLNYHYMLGRGERPLQDLDHSGGGADYEIDLAQFKILLAAVMDG